MDKIEKIKKEVLERSGRVKGFRDLDSFRNWAGDRQVFYFDEVENLIT